MVGPSVDAAAAKLLHHHYLKPSLSSSAIKFLCSHGGKIIPRYTDGKLRYHGGETRVLSVHRSISFSELLMKMGELCGSPVSLRCQLPTEDLDALVSITSDEDLAILIEEYDRAVATPNGSLKIRAFLWPPKKMSPFTHPPSSTLASHSSFKLSSLSSSSSSSSSSLSSSSSSLSSSSSSNGGAATFAPTPRCYRQFSEPVAYPVKSIPSYGYHAYGNPTTYVYLVPNGHHWK